MDNPASLQQTLSAAVNALEALKARLDAGNGVDAAPGEAELQGALGQAIANLTELNKVAGLGQTETEAPEQEVDTNANASAPVEAVENSDPVVPRRVIEGNEKIIHVPVRQRTGTARPVDPAARTVTLELPVTPFHQKTAGTDAPPSQVKPTPGVPADTPMAAEILASLSALGIQLPNNMQQTLAAFAPSPGPETLSRAALPANTDAPLGRRAAAIRAAEFSASLVSRPKPPRKEHTPVLPGLPFNSSGRKSCNCKRSQCLKLYCECFAAGGFCLPGCQCYNCLNTVAEVDTVEAARAAILAKNPRAFNDKVVGDAHKKGCRCKRSKCLKKYCECYNAGVKCNPDVCQCDGCHNNTAYFPDDEQFNGMGLPVEYGAEDEEDYPMGEDEPAYGKAPVIPAIAAAAAAIDENKETNVLPALLPLEAIQAELHGSSVPSSLPTAADGAPAPAAAELAPGLDAAAVAATAADAVEHVDNQDQKGPLPQLPKPALNAGDMATPGGALRAGPSALTESHLSDMVVDGETIDTATSPAVGGSADNQAALLVSQNDRRVAAATMTGAVAKVGGAARHKGPSTGSAGNASTGGRASMDSADGGSRGKRPRRAASGGVQGAVAAATSDWGLDLVSPPPKRSNSMPDGMDLRGSGGTAAAARRDRNALLRRALHNDAAQGAAAGGGASEADAITALVSLNNKS